ncbi:MAG: GntR family transcriptional regulator [Propionibacteriaceae bacterium]|nr:GntR family transcriptional regulator [Propionibacteriaceae bacterium]
MTDSHTHLTGAKGRRHVSDQIKKALQHGELAPGQRLVEQDLADTYNASRSAVRDALVDLSAEDIIVLVPQRGARVRVISVEEAVQSTECRSALERLCARKAALLASDKQLDELRDIGQKMTAAVEAGEFDTYSTLNRYLHTWIVDASGQKVAKRQLDRLSNQLVRYQFRLALRPGRSAESLVQHRDIINAVCAHDPEAADAAIARHLDSVIEQLKATPAGNDRRF